MSFFGAIRGFIMRLFPIKPAVKAFHLTVPAMANIPELESLWRDLYDGKPPYLSGRQKYLNIPCMVCYDVARLSVSEAYATTSDEVAQSVFDDVIKPILQPAIEASLAIGSVFIRPWVDASGRCHADIYTMEDALPVDFNEGKIIGVVFVQRKVEHPSSYQTVTYTKLEYQKYDPITDTFSVQNKAYKKVGVPSEEDLGLEVSLGAVDEWADITPEWSVSNAGRPLFVAVETPWTIAGSPIRGIGASIFATATDQIEELQERRNQLDWEYFSGKRKLVVDESALPTDDRGNLRLTPEDAELYRKLSGSMTASGAVTDLFADFTPTIRVNEFQQDIKRLLNEIAKSCHMSNGYLSFDEQTSAVTAQEIRSRDKDSYATVCNVQNTMAEPTIRGLLECYSIMLSVMGFQSFDYETATNDDNFSIVWGDGIMDDPDAERATAQAEVTAGLMSKLYYMTHFRGLTQEEAEAELAQMKDEAPAPAEDFFGA